jgi:hypothetical protein
MKKNSYSIKKPKWGLIALTAVFVCLFGNGAVAQVTNTNYHWGGTVDNSWSNINNWSKTGRYVHTADFASGSTTITIVTANLQGAAPTTVLAVGHAIVGPGIPANTTVTAFSATPATGVTITLSQATTAAGSAAIIQTYLKSTTLPAATTGNSTLGTTSTVIIDNATLGSPVITTNPAASIILMRNQFGPSSGTTLTINSGASLTVNHYAASPVSLAGGNIVNNGTLSITSTSVAASTGIVCVTPTAAPSVATEYGYSGSGALNINLSASTTANSAGVSVTSLNANTTYKMLFDGTTSISLGSTATSFALRTAGGVNASSLIVGGTGFTIGTVGSPVNGGLLSLGAQSSVTVNSGTTLTLNSASTNITRAITSFSSSAVATNFTNNGTINIQGASTNSGLFFSTGTSASAVPFNINNVGTLNLNMSCSGIATAVLATGNGGGAGATGTAVNINNSGSLTLKNTSTATGTGFAILGSNTGEAPAVIITNSGTLNLEGTVASYGLKTSIINSGILNTNGELRSFSAITNANGASINFVRTAATATSKLVTFNVVSPSTTSATAGATFSLEGNTYTVIFQKFAAAFGTTLYTSVISSADTSALSQSGTLTYVSGTASGNIAYAPTEAVVGPPAVEAVAGFSASSVSGALTSGTANSGTINTDTASNLNTLSGVSSTSSTSVIAPGGSSGKGIADFKRYSWLILNGKVQIQVSGNTTAGVDYDQLNNSFDYGGIDISNAVLDLTGIYTPSADLATPIDIMNTGTITPLIGTFASVTGLGTGWSVVYNYPNGELINSETSLPYVPSRANGGKVQLVYATPAPPTITQLSSNGTDTITQGCTGSTLVILGTNFTGTTGVTVNGVALTGVTINSNTKITAVLPTEATSGQVVVTNAVSPSTSTAAFTVVANTTTITAINACDSYYWANTGTTYTVGGVYTGTTTNCETQQLNLTISTSTPPPTTTVVVCGSSYVWPSNGVTYTTPGTKTAVVGCVTETLNLSFQSSVIPTFDAVTAICTGGSLTALPTTSTNSIPGTWSPALNNLTTTEYTFTPAEGQCASTATLTITVNSLPTATITAGGSTTICAGDSVTLTANEGSSYLWSPGGATTQSISAATAGDYTVTVTNSNSCSATSATTTVTLSSTPATTTGSVTLTQYGGSYTWPANGVTYTASATETVVTPCNIATLNLTIITTQMPSSPYALCAGATVGSTTAGTTLKFYKDTKATTAAFAGTTKLAAITYYVTETPVGGTESTPRVPITVTLAALVAPTTISSTETKVICKYMGTPNLVTFTTTPVVGGNGQYNWTVPAGAAIVGNATGDSIQVSFEEVTNSIITGLPGLIGSVTVDSRNDLGCLSGKPKVLSLITKAPSAPKSVVLTYNGVVIKKAGNFVGDATKALTLTATDISGTADHHVWSLPTNTTVVSGDANNDLVITVHLGNVTASNDALVFSCASVGGCGSSTKSLSIARAAAGTPKAITLTDALSATPAVAIKKLDAYTGSFKTRALTLTATPNATAGLQATSYKWILPAAATVVGGSATAVEGEANTYTSESNVISVNLASVASETSFIFKVFGVNGNGISLLSKDLTCTSALPKAPAAIYAGTNTSVTGTKFLAYNPSCGEVTISVPEVFGVDNDFEIVGVSSGNTVNLTHTQGSNTATIDLATAGGSLLAKSTLTIRAIAYTATGSVYKDYIVKFGATCSAPVKIAAEAAVADEFSVIAYPNPSATEFTIESSSKGATNVQVYDMTGRLIENAQTTSNSVQVGRNYASGVYNVIVSQGANVKTLKVIKK